MPSARLIVRSPGQPEREVRLETGASIGRAPDNSVRVQVDGVSRYHAIIEHKEDGFWLSDLGSKNGTTVNGVPIASDCRLGNGNLILLGGVTTLEFQTEVDVPTPTNGAPQDKQESQEPALASAETGKAGGISPGTTLKVGLAILAVVALVFVAARILIYSAASPGSLKARSSTEPGTGSGPVAGAQSQSTGQSGDVEGSGIQGHDSANSGAANQSIADAGAPDPKNASAAVEAQFMIEGLAKQISGRSGYSFRREFVEQTIRLIPEYKSGALAGARQHSNEIQAAFHDSAIDPVFGLILAMSLAPSGSSDSGIWGLQPSLLRANGYLRAEEDDAVLKDPKGATRIAAVYLKNLLGQFGGKQNFMYVIAFYGEPSAVVREALGRLDTIDPLGTRRLDFWSMVEAAVVKAEQAERVIRFFAAGIVGENPQKFGLSGAPLSFGT
jgi:FHA domain-containing protein